MRALGLIANVERNITAECTQLAEELRVDGATQLVVGQVPEASLECD